MTIKDDSSPIQESLPAAFIVMERVATGATGTGRWTVPNISKDEIIAHSTQSAAEKERNSLLQTNRDKIYGVFTLVNQMSYRAIPVIGTVNNSVGLVKLPD